MSYVSLALRRAMVAHAKPLRTLYSTAAKSAAENPRTTPGQELREMFSARRVKRNWELAPLFIIMSGAVVGLCGYIAYASQTRDDVKYAAKANWERTDLLNPQKRKLVVFDQEYRPLTEVAEAYKGMEEAEKTE